MTDHLQTVEHTVDAQGFVLVEGERVLCRPGEPLKSRPVAMGTCQLCARVNVAIPQRVVTEYEHAIPMRRYFHASPVGAFNAIEYRLCAECRDALNTRSQGAT